MNTKNYLDDEIKRLYDRMSTLDPETPEYAALEENWAKLVSQKLEFEKNKADNKHRVAGLILDGFKVVLPIALTAVGTAVAFTFEEKGTISSSVGKKFLDKLFKY